MKKLIVLLLITTLLVACTQEGEPEDSQENANNDGETERENGDQTEEGNEEPEADFYLDTVTIDDQEVIEVEHLIDQVDGEYEYDETHRTLSMNIHEQEYYLIYGVPVLERNGLYLANEEITIILDDDEIPHLPLSFLTEGLEADVMESDEEQLAFVYNDEAVEAIATNEDPVDIHSMEVEEMIEYLSFLDYPIEDATVSTVESHLPGAPRDYRNGYHEGIDWYDYASGVEITTDTPIYGMAEGTVVRVDHGYEEFSSPEARDEQLAHTAELGFTPEYLLDRLRGQQVWVQYDNGVMNRFAHLDDIPVGLKLGDQIDSETVIGYVGNSGTSGAVNQDDSGLHLHHDLLIYGEYFWEPFSLPEVKDVLLEIWG